MSTKNMQAGSPDQRAKSIEKSIDRIINDRIKRSNSYKAAAGQRKPKADKGI